MLPLGERFPGLRVGNRQEGVGVLEEAVELGFEFGEFGRILVREVVVFAGIGGEVVELGAFLEVIDDEFPIAITDGGRRDAALVSPMRIVPEQR